MAAASRDEFQLNVPKTAQSVEVKLGCDVTVPCHLSPEISAVDMEIRWFKETDCVCIYKNRQMTEGKYHEGRVNLFTHELLERGDVSLSLRDFRESDVGDYLCQVISGDTTEEITVKVLNTNVRSEDSNTYSILIDMILRTWTEEEKMKMESSALIAVLKKGLGSGDLDTYNVQTEKVDRTCTKEEIIQMEYSVLVAELMAKYKSPEDFKNFITEKDAKIKHLEEQRERLLLEKDKIIQDKDDMSQKCKQKLEIKDMALKEKDRHLKDMDDKLLQTTKELKEKQNQLEEKETQMDNINKLMGEKERLLENKVKALETSKHQLDTLRNELQEMKTQLDEQKTKFTYQEKTLQEHKQQQKQSDQEIKNLHSELERLKNELERLEDTEKLLDERETQIKDLEKSKEMALEEKDKLLNKSNDKLVQTTREIEEKQREIEEKNKLMSEKERLLENTVKELEASKHQLDTLRNELQENKSQLQLLLEENNQLKSSAPVRRNSMEKNPPTMSGETASVLVSGSELRLVLLGSAGSEKSASVNIILNREEKIQTDTSTEIQQSESRQGEVNGKQVTVVETPDWFCSGLSLEEVREDVRLCVHLSAPGPHAFLLIIPVQQSTGVEKAMLEKMEEIFGERCWRNTMILFTVTDEEQKKIIEDFQSRNQEVQRLVEKCGKRFLFLNIHQSGDDSQISELLEKIEKMVQGNTERFYSSEIYLEIESQIRAMEKNIIRDREERKEKEEREMKEKIEKELQRSMKKIEGAIEEHEGDIKQLNERTGELERQMRDERDEEKKKELKRELEKEVEKRSELERKINKLKDQREREKSEMEKKHREEMEEIRQMYEGEMRVETKRNLMKIILPELKRNISDSKSKMQEEFNRQMEEKNREIETLKNHFSELKEEYSSLCEFHESAIGILKTS
ncbi:uncharacterized protein [Paramisgurnus dabryanus]|uniref:uncharacterized protein n=1 Tax=Paramisgurnus dabryanus TaxID=90735 RepID=UPI003CCFACCE